MSVCLAMIVRNAAETIDACLNAAAPLIDNAIIIDTGSSDDTRDRIRAHNWKPLERPWIDFQHNRSELMAAAKDQADYLLLLDADMTLHHSGPLPELTADIYEGTMRLGNFDYALPLIVKGDRDWRYEGVAHSYLTSDLPATTERLPGLSVDIAASTGIDKLERDLAALSREHAEKPLDPRTTFYLAQTYQDLGRPLEAIQTYRARAHQTGWDEETFYAHYRLGCLLGENVHGLDGMRELLAAYALRPGRAEPLRVLARLATTIADKIPYPTDRLFVHRDAYASAPVPKTVTDISAVIVTRGNVDLRPILDQLPYTDTIIWDNSQRPEDQKCYGRFLAMAEAKNDLIFCIDDDVIFRAHAELRAAHQPGRITANMPSPWYENAGYDKERSVQVGAGSLMEPELPWPAFDAYLAEWPLDELFLTYCDDIAGILSPSYRVDLGYTVLPHASAPGRIYTTPGSQERRAEVARRALEIRERAAVV